MGMQIQMLPDASVGPPAWSREALDRHGADPAIDWELVYATASTNEDLCARSRRTSPVRPIVRAARLQRAGRGRRGRAWVGSEGGSLLFSCALAWTRSQEDSAAVTLACGLALARCIEREGVRVALKWPNDLLIDGRKFAGILTEMVEGEDGTRTLVVGVGANLLADAVQRQAVDRPIASLDEGIARERLVERERWLARFAQAIVEAAREFESAGFSPVREAFEEFLAWRGEWVAVQAEDRILSRGRLEGVDDSGRLLLERGGKVVPVAGGELGLARAIPLATDAP
jgi:BirA family transcriptional regulator, biotin operon repressor / biotin---[acetyl-CoA-carboxylase] ligase